MEKLSLILTSRWAVAFTAMIFLAVAIYNPSPVETLQLKTFDYFITSLDNKQSEEVVLVEFGEK